MAADSSNHKNHAHELGAGLVGSTIAEGAAVAESAKKYRNLKAKGFQATPEEMGAIARKIGAKNAAIAGLGLQGVNMAIGAGAAHHLLKKPKGSAMNTGQSAVSKSQGSVSRNGHGKNLNNKKNGIVASNTIASGAIGAGSAGYLGHMLGDGGFERSLTGVKEDKATKPKREMVRGSRSSNREYEKMMRANGLMQKKTLAEHGKRAKALAGKNKWAVGGAVAGGALGAVDGAIRGQEYVNAAHRSGIQKSLVEVSKGLPSSVNTATMMSSHTSDRIMANAYGKNVSSRVSAVRNQAGKDTGPLSGLRAEQEAKRIRDAKKTGIDLRSESRRALDKPSKRASSFKESGVGKAYRRFDPEADRQRRLGLYSGAAAGTGVVLGREAARNYTVSGLDSASRAKDGLGIKLKPGLTKRGLGLTAAALGASVVSAGSYKRGVSARNQPWT